MSEEINKTAEEQMETTEESVLVVTPEGEPLYEVDVNINASVLYDYFLRHMYNSFSGLLGTCVGVFLIMMFVLKDAHVLYLICGIVVIFYLPVSLFMTSRTQALQESFQKPLHYTFYENGMQVSQDEVKQMIRWEDAVKAVSTSKSIIVYTGKNAASIFPRKDMGEDTVGLIQIICTHMDPKKVKIKE